MVFKAIIFYLIQILFYTVRTMNIIYVFKKEKQIRAIFESKMGKEGKTSR